VTEPEPAVTALILAGGRSSRFGRDKLAEPIDGRPLLWHAIDAVRPLVDEVLIVSAPGADPIVPDDVLVVRDRVAFEGPLTGLLAGLLEARAPVVIVAGGDMPTMVGAVLAEMLAELDGRAVTSVRGDRDGVDAVVLESDGQARPLPMALRREPALIATARLLDAGERRLRSVTEALDTRVIEAPTWRALDPEGQTLIDIDEPSDLA
jgi:molybdopterin-guanine dinucleotide biosynthesis protein A